MLGKVLYKLYHQPKNKLCQLYKQNTPDYKLIELGKQQMQRSAETLNEIYIKDAPVFNVCFLTGKKFWYQAIFCLHSLQKVSKDVQINAVFYDDGSLGREMHHHINLTFPHSKSISHAYLEETVNNALPYNKFPYIRQTREFYPHLKKLTDIHSSQKGWKLVLDSDMLFFKYPAEIIDWFKQPSKPLVLQDKKQSYGYSINLLEKILGTKLPELINVGITGMKSESIDWEKLEYWIKGLSVKKNSYYLEQTLIAMLLSGMPAEVLNPAEYLVLPDIKAVKQQKGILHHYVAGSKKIYFTEAWKQIL